VSLAVMKILEDDSYHREVANSVLMNFDVPAARGFGQMQKDHYSKDSGSETDNDDDKTVPMSVDGEDGLATQPDDDDSKCAMALVGEFATDHSSVKSEDY
jgi:hypothetical protein